MAEEDLETTLLETLDTRQDEVLSGLDELNERVVATLAEWTRHESEPEEHLAQPLAGEMKAAENSEAA